MMSAASAFRGVAGFATAYSSAKAGMNGLMLAIATTYGSRGIRCNSIAPGLIMVSPSESQDKHRKQSRGLTERPGRPSDIASTVLFLASEGGQYINGQILAVDGGLTSHMPGLSQPA
jgi:NAD(P)-dependent dehydrogenase (short-subunit alcohol dehydrogenase family)